MEGGTYRGWDLRQDTKEKVPSSSIQLFLFPDCRGNGSSCLNFLLPCLPFHDRLYPPTGSQRDSFFPQALLVSFFGNKVGGIGLNPQQPLTVSHFATL